MISPPMSYFDAWLIGMKISENNLLNGLVDNQGTDCLEMKEKVIEMMINEKMDIQK